MSGFMWKATVRNVRRAFRKINGFEWGETIGRSLGRYLTILEDEVEKDLENPCYLPLSREFLWKSKEEPGPMGVFSNRSSMEGILYVVFLHYNSKG